MAVNPIIIFARFWSKVSVTNYKRDCWEWTGATRRDGYGNFKFRGINYSSHRLAWEMANGEPLGDRLALHKCDNAKCCNPQHIYPGTRTDNAADVLARTGRSNFKLSHSDVLEIRSNVAEGLSRTAIAADFGVSETTISRVSNRVSWRAVKP